jgi:hypothetical protein
MCMFLSRNTLNADYTNTHTNFGCFLLVCVHNAKEKHHCFLFKFFYDLYACEKNVPCLSLHVSYEGAYKRNMTYSMYMFLTCTCDRGIPKDSMFKVRLGT